MIGILLLTIGALNATLALTVGTCTQGDAGGLYGGFLTLFFYLIGLATIRAWPPPIWAFATLFPGVAIAVWHSVFTLRFMWGFWRHGMSACYAIKGGFSLENAGEWMDGGETLLGFLWLAISVIFWIAVVVGARGSIQARHLG